MSARQWDVRLHAWVGALPSTDADRWLRRFSNAANHGRLWLAIAALLAARKGPTRRGAVRGVGSMAVSSALVNGVLKQLFRRRRPPLPLERTQRHLRRPPVSRSFPSGHSASAAAFVTGVALEQPLAGAALAPLALGVGYSRVHVGVHFPGDVVAGFAVGSAIALGSQHWWKVRPTTPARVRPAHSAPALPDGGGLVLAVNPEAGPDDQDPAADLRLLLPRADIRELDGGDLRSLLDGPAKAIGVAGGDGTVNSAAGIALERGLPLVVVPAGTLNHFARDIGVTTTEDATDAVTSGDAVQVDVADVNGRPFLNTASIGAYPEMVRRRDRLAHRMGKLLALTVATAQVLRHGQPVSVTVNDIPLKVWILFVGNCCYTPRGLSPAWRPRLEDGLLDVQYLRADLRFGRTRAVLATLLGVSEHTRSYAQFQAEEVRVVCRDGAEQVAVDGEPGETATEFHFTKRGRLTVYCRRAPE